MGEEDRCGESHSLLPKATDPWRWVTIALFSLFTMANAFMFTNFTTEFEVTRPVSTARKRSCARALVCERACVHAFVCACMCVCVSVCVSRARAGVCVCALECVRVHARACVDCGGQLTLWAIVRAVAGDSVCVGRGGGGGGHCVRRSGAGGATAR
jgi:hypothetical protein